MKTDERVRLMDEIISGVQVIKLYAWEKPFEKLIKYARKAELKVVTKSSYVRGLFMTFNLFTTRVSLFCALLTMALMEQPITATKVNRNAFRIFFILGIFRCLFLCLILMCYPKRCHLCS